VELTFAGVNVILAGQTYDWVSAELSGLHASVETTFRDALGVTFSTQAIAIRDCYSRDTCYRQLFFRDTLSNQPMIRFCASTVSVVTNDDVRVEKYVDLNVQPLHIICNTAIVPAIIGFARLASDESVEQVSQQVQQKLKGIFQELANSNFLKKIIHSASNLERKENEDIETHLVAVARIGSVRIVLPNESYPQYMSGLSAVVSMEGFDVLTEDTATNVHRPFDTFLATLRCLEIYCCDRDDLINAYGAGERERACSPSDANFDKRYVLTPITLPLVVQMSTGFEDEVDKMIIRAEMKLRLQLTIVALREFVSISMSAYNTMNMRGKPLSKQLVSNAVSIAKSKSPRAVSDDEVDSADQKLDTDPSGDDIPSPKNWSKKLRRYKSTDLAEDRANWARSGPRACSHTPLLMADRVCWRHCSPFSGGR
jgi:hypothetical protein